MSMKMWNEAECIQKKEKKRNNNNQRTSTKLVDHAGTWMLHHCEAMCTRKKKREVFLVSALLAYANTASYGAV